MVNTNSNKWVYIGNNQIYIHIYSLNYWFEVEKLRFVRCKSQPLHLTISSRSLNSSLLIFQLDILSSLIFGNAMNFSAVIFVSGTAVLPRTSKIFKFSNVFSLRIEQIKESVRKTEKFPSKLIHSIFFTPE